MYDHQQINFNLAFTLERHLSLTKIYRIFACHVAKAFRKEESLVAERLYRENHLDVYHHWILKINPWSILTCLHGQMQRIISTHESPRNLYPVWQRRFNVNTWEDMGNILDSEAKPRFSSLTAFIDSERQHGSSDYWFFTRVGGGHIALAANTRPVIFTTILGCAFSSVWSSTSISSLHRNWAIHEKPAVLRFKQAAKDSWFD